ncbi:MAG TPA: hypothetical protein VJ603_01550 [Paucimonas sp.]|nr:hypothetical protein [Paucimonas sp.]
MAEQNRIARRSFFASLGLVAAAGIAAKLSSWSEAPDSVQSVPAEPDGNGYRLTEHVRKYYRTTKI